VSSSIKLLARGTVLYGLGEVLSRLTTLLLLPVFTAYLSPSDYGVISILAGLGVFLTPVFSLGLGAAIAPVYFEGNSRVRKETAISTTAAILVASVGALLVAGGMTSRTISVLLFRSDQYAALVFISIVTTSFTILTIPFRQYLQFEERAASYVVLSALSILTTTVLSVVMVVWLRRGVLGMLEASLVGQAVGCGLFAVPAIRAIRPTLTSAIGLELLKISLPLVPAFGCLFLLQHGSKYLLQWLGSLEQVGIYTVGFNIGLVISLVVTSFQNAWIPYFMSYAERPSESRIVFGRVLTYYVVGVGTLTLGVFAIARPLILLLTKPAYHDAWTVVGLSATAQFLAGVYAVLLPGMYIAKDVQYTGLLQGVAATVGVLCNILLIPRLGISGAAISLVGSYAVLALVQHAWNRWRRYPAVSYEYRRLLRYFLGFSAYAGLALVRRDLTLPQEGAFSAVLVLMLPCLVYSVLTSAERRTVWQFVRTYRRASLVPDVGDPLAASRKARQL
jgi:O-antigen/teichoic acid export membrane protein